MKIKYDSKIDALYIDLAEGLYDKSKKITGNIVVDLTKEGKVLGIEILDASENIQKFNPVNFTPKSLRT
ncbi:MAG: DUF2283 domain-containing protein [Patescibacteria group bacterium]